jgi:hypothetical protein
VNGFELMAGVVAAFFASGIMTGVFAVIALSAMRHRRKPAAKRLAWEDQLAWGRPLAADDGYEAPPRWPRYRGLLIRGD